MTEKELWERTMRVDSKLMQRNNALDRTKQRHALSS